MKGHIQFIPQKDPYGREPFQVWDGTDEQGFYSIIGQIRFNKATKDFHCSIKKRFSWEFAQRHKSIDDAKEYFIQRFK